MAGIALNHTTIGDAGIESLLSLRGLERLELRGTAITEKGVRLLGELESLRSLDLRETRVTQAEVASLQARRPQLKVLVDSAK